MQFCVARSGYSTRHTLVPHPGPRPAAPCACCVAVIFLELPRIAQEHEQQRHSTEKPEEHT
jgi:hypothetical protein